MTDYRLGPLEREHLPILQQWRNADWAREHVREVRYLSMTDQERWWDGDGHWYLMGVYDEDHLVGVGGLMYPDWVNRHAELSILAPEYEAEVEGGNLILTYAFDHLNLHRVTAECYTEDREQLIEELGFTQEGKRRQALFRDGRWRDTTIWAKLASDA